MYTPRVCSLSAVWLKRRGSPVCSFCRPEDEGTLVFHEAPLGGVPSSLGMQTERSCTPVPSGALHPPAALDALPPRLCIACRFVATRSLSPLLLLFKNVIFRPGTWSKILANWSESRGLFGIQGQTLTLCSHFPRLSEMIWGWFVDLSQLTVFCILLETKIWPHAQFTRD